MCKYKTKAWPVIFYLTVFFIFSTSLYSKRQISIVLSHVFFFLIMLLFSSWSFKSRILWFCVNEKSISRPWSNLHTSSSFKSATWVYLYKSFGLCFFKLSCTLGCSRINRAQNPWSMKSSFSYISVMHFHSYKIQFQKYLNLITCLTAYLVLGICPSHSPEVKKPVGTL